MNTQPIPTSDAIAQITDEGCIAIESRDETGTHVILECPVDDGKLPNDPLPSLARFLTVCSFAFYVGAIALTVAHGLVS